MLAQSLFVALWPLLEMQSAADCETDTPIANVSPGKKPDVETILDEWQRREPEIRRASVQLKRYEYDTVFATEERSDVALQFEPRLRYLFKTTPVELPEDSVSAKRDRFGDTYQFRSAEPTTWFIDGQSVVHINDAENKYSTAEFQHRDKLHDLYHVLNPQPQSFMESLRNLRLVITGRFDLHAAIATGTRVDQLRSHLHWSSGTQSNDRQIHLIARAQGNARRNFHLLEIILDAKSYRTKAYRFVNPAGTKETVFVVKVVLVNENAEEFTPPDLTGYESVQPSIPAAKDTNKPAQPPEGTNAETS